MPKVRLLYTCVVCLVRRGLLAWVGSLFSWLYSSAHRLPPAHLHALHLLRLFDWSLKESSADHHGIKLKTDLFTFTDFLPVFPVALLHSRLITGLTVSLPFICPSAIHLRLPLAFCALSQLQLQCRLSTTLSTDTGFHPLRLQPDLSPITKTPVFTSCIWFLWFVTSYKMLYFCCPHWTLGESIIPFHQNDTKLSLNHSHVHFTIILIDIFFNKTIMWLWCFPITEQLCSNWNNVSQITQHPLWWAELPGNTLDRWLAKELWRDFDLHARPCFTHNALWRIKTHMRSCSDADTNTHVYTSWSTSIIQSVTHRSDTQRETHMYATCFRQAIVSQGGAAFFAESTLQWFSEGSSEHHRVLSYLIQMFSSSEEFRASRYLSSEDQ